MRELDGGSANLAAIQAFEERLAAGEEELIPAAFADRIIDGENPVRVWRDYRGLSVSALAKRAGIAGPYLSQIESGSRKGSVETYKALADALDVTLDDLV